MTKRNTNNIRRTLAVIADDIHALERDRMLALFEVGDLLLEARAACAHGDWYDWLYDNFEWSEDTAENYMNAAKLPRSVRDLRLAKTTFYALTHQGNDVLPSILNALVKAGARKRQFKPDEADKIIRLVRLRCDYGDLTDAALLAIEMWGGNPETLDKIVAALRKAKPTTEAEADKIVADNHTAYLLPPPVDDGPSPGDDDDDDDDDESPPPPPPSPPSPPPSPLLDIKLIEALRALLDRAIAHSMAAAMRPVPVPIAACGEFTGVDLERIADFVNTLHRAMTKGSMAKLAADRAEARSRKAASAP